jgi:hypothetical protein
MPRVAPRGVAGPVWAAAAPTMGADKKTGSIATSFPCYCLLGDKTFPLI